MPAPAQLEVLALIDGHATVTQVVKRARGMAPDVLRANLNEFIDKNFVSIVTDSAYTAIDSGDFFTLNATRTATPGQMGRHIPGRRARLCSREFWAASTAISRSPFRFIPWSRPSRRYSA